MARLTENDGREFTVTRTPDVESAGYPCLFAVTLDGHTAVRVTKGGLQSIKREISRALRDAKEACVLSSCYRPVWREFSFRKSGRF